MWVKWLVIVTYMEIISAINALNRSRTALAFSAELFLPPIRKSQPSEIFPSEDDGKGSKEEYASRMQQLGTLYALRRRKDSS